MTALLDIPIDSIQGEATSLADHSGSVVLVVNVASQCGLTPQYEGLEALYQRYRDEGLVVAGFPANDFGAQEPGTNEEIAEFCSSSYSVTFPLFSKITVVGEDQHPLYAELTAQAPTAIGDKEAFRANLRKFDMPVTEDPEVVWNFEKFLVSRSGEVVARFAPTVVPDDPDLVAAVELELSKS